MDEMLHCEEVQGRPAGSLRWRAALWEASFSPTGGCLQGLGTAVRPSFCLDEERPEAGMQAGNSHTWQWASESHEHTLTCMHTRLLQHMQKEKYSGTGTGGTDGGVAQGHKDRLAESNRKGEGRGEER